MELKITAEMQQYINEIIEITQGDVYDSLESLILDALYVLREDREEKMKELGKMLYAAIESGEPISHEQVLKEVFEELQLNEDGNTNSI